MADSSIIREFLVLIGYKDDTEGLKKFEKGIAKATKGVVGFAAAVEASALAVSIGVARFANELESLYFASIRTGTAASSLKAFDRAAQSFGTSAGEAMQSAEGLARFFRNNPGGAQYLNAFLGQVGESAFNANGSVKDTAELMESLGKLFASNTANGRGFQNAQIAGIFGIDEKTMLAIQNGDFLRKYKETQAYMKSSGLDAAADGAHRFSESLRKLMDQLYVLGVRIVDVLQKKLGISLDSITAWLQTHGPEIATGIAHYVGLIIDDFQKMVTWFQAHWPAISRDIGKVATVLEKLYTAAKPIFSWLINKFISLDDATGGWSTTIIALLAIMSKLGAFDILAGIWGMAKAIKAIGAGIGLIAEGGGVLGAVASALGIISGIGAAAAAGLGIGWLVNKLFPSVGEGLTNAFQWIDDKRHPAQSVVRDLMANGLSHSQASAVASNLYYESSFNPSAVNYDKNGKEYYGLAQLGPDEQAEYRRIMGHDIHDDWNNQGNQLQFLVKRLRDSGDPNLRKAWALMQAHMDDTLMNADFNARVYDRYYERPGDYANEDPKRAAGAVSISQKTDIHIHADPDPHKTKDLVLDGQDRVNQKIVREFTPGFS